MSNGVVSFPAARRSALAEGEFLAMKAALARGDPITVEAFHEMVATALEHVGARMLALPAEIVPRLVCAETTDEAETVIYDAIYAALNELADEAVAAVSDGPANDPGGPEAA